MLTIDKNSLSTARSSTDAHAPINLVGGIQYILRQWKRHWQAALLVFLTLFVYEMFKTFFALSLKAIIDSLQATGHPQNLAGILGALFVGFLIAFGSRWLSEKLIAQVGVQILN